MNRINVYRYPTDEYDADGPYLDGWFDAEKADEIAEDTEWNGNNHISVHTRSQWEHQALYRTAKGRWVLHCWSNRQGTTPTYEFITDDTARQWLTRNGSDNLIEKYFGEPLEAERGPGRPIEGRPVNIRLEEDAIAQLDQRAAAEGVSRAEMVRRLVAAGLAGQGPQAHRTGGE